MEKTRNIAHKFSGKWIRNGFLKKEAEGMLSAAQAQALRINSIKAKIDKQPISPKCRLCGTEEETIMHLVSGWELYKKHGLESLDRWYEHTPAVVENDEVELYWNITIQTDMTVAHNRPDIMLVEKAIRKWTIINIAVPGDFNVVRTEDWKVEKY